MVISNKCIIFVCVKQFNINKMEVQEILKEAKLDWSVRTETIQTVSGIEIPESMAIVREDTN